jgi:hypothetical protein
MVRKRGDQLLVYDWVFTSVKALPFYESFPRGFTCWHLRRKLDRAGLIETVHRILTVDLALPNNLVAWTLYEWDAFRYRKVNELMHHKHRVLESLQE